MTCVSLLLRVILTLFRVACATHTHTHTHTTATSDVVSNVVSDVVSGTVAPPWLLNYSATEWRSDGVRNKQQISNQLEFFRHLIRKEMKKLKDQKASDGESVDALEHFFWGE
jgi:hypothetical protein